jgi:hypothetical protein
MTTRVYGTSDDLIEFEGDVSGEVGEFGTEERDRGVLVNFGDGTLLEFKYCGRTDGCWSIRVFCVGRLLDHIVTCDDEDAKIYSDVAHFKDGLTWAKQTSDWMPKATGKWNNVE